MRAKSLPWRKGMFFLMAIIALLLCLFSTIGATNVKASETLTSEESQQSVSSEDSLTNDGWIVSDLLDYQPNDLVTLTGGDWLGDSEVRIIVEDISSPSQTWSLGENVSVADDGSVQFVFRLPDWIVAVYRVTVIGATTGRTATTTFYDSAGSYSLTFRSYDPTYYDFKLPSSYPTLPSGRAQDPMPGANSAQTLASLNPSNLALGQIVPFEIKITVNGSVAPENGTINILNGWNTLTTNNSNFGFDPAYGVLAAFVDTTAPFTVDPRANATVSSFTSALVGSEIQGNFTVSGLDSGDTVILEVWVVLKKIIPERVSGNVQSRLISANTVATPPAKISTGNQTIPLLRVNDFLTTNVDVSLVKSDLIDPLYAGDTLIYTITATNTSPSSVANGIIITDTLDPNVTFISASGGGSANGGVITWPAFSLDSNTSIHFTVTVSVNQSAPTAYGAGLPDNRGGPTATVPTFSPAPDLLNVVRIVSTISPDPNTANNDWREPTNVLPRTSVTAIKNWIGGPSTDHVPVTLALYRQIGSGTPVKVTDSNATISPTTGPSSTFTYIWAGLPVYDPLGQVYQYTVDEVDVNGNPTTITNYTKTFSADHLNVTNTYVSPTIAINASKTWVNGPAGKDTVQFQLYRKIGTSGTPEIIGNPVTVPSSNQSGTYSINVPLGNYPQYNFNGVPYIYYVQELTTPLNYAKVESGLTVTNTYVVPKVSITGTKTWNNDTPGHRPNSLTIVLNRSVSDQPSEPIKTITVSPDSLGNWSYDFGLLDRTDINGNEYIYSITEAAIANYNTSYTPLYTTADGIIHLDVTNTLVKGSIYIKKVDDYGYVIMNNPAIFKITRISPEGSPFTQQLLMDESGRLVFTDLMAGTYVLEEIKAPSGYNLPKGTVTITIEKDGAGNVVVRTNSGQLITAEQPLEITNTPSLPLPATGGAGTIQFTWIGLGTMVGAICYYREIKRNKKKVGNHTNRESKGGKRDE